METPKHMVCIITTAVGMYQEIDVSCNHRQGKGTRVEVRFRARFRVLLEVRVEVMGMIEG